MVNDLICKEGASLLEVLQIYNKTTKGIVFVVDQENKLKGIVSEGDIRRALIEGTELHSTIETIMSPDFVSAQQGTPFDEIIKLTSERIRYVPIVDDNFRIIDYVQYDSRLHLPVASPNLGGNEFKYLVEAYLSTWISSSGKYITQFESNFASYCNQNYGIATSNGTTALHLALVTLGIEKGDEVIIPDLTFAATINAVLYCGATPIIVDIEEDSWCIDPQAIQNAITPKTKAIIPVHVYGQPCKMDQIMEIARNNDLKVIEDCAEAHGAMFQGKTVGSFGDINCFSFFANKIITTGEGGMCLTQSKELSEKMKVYRDHGMNKNKRYWHDVIGFNYRMTNLQAAIGVGQLERIDEIIAFRQEIEENYKNQLSRISNLDFQLKLPDREKTTWLVCALVTDGKRDQYMKQLNTIGVDCRPFFYPLSSMDIYQKYSSDCPVSTKISNQGMNFPTSGKVDQETMDLIIKVFKD